MPEIHIPHLDDHEEQPAAQPAAHRRRGYSLLKIALEVVLIGTGVFLGVAGEQWRERVRHREVAEASLRGFRSEILTNRKAVAAVKDYHATLLKSAQTYLAADAKTRPAVRRDLSIQGLQPVAFEHTAWDLALATQSLAYIDSQLAFALARVYNSQQGYADLTRGILQAMYLRPPDENFDGFLHALTVYYGDIVLTEPALLRMYDELRPRIDRALGDSSSGEPSAK